jgi:hypothetical protein
MGTQTRHRRWPALGLNGISPAYAAAPSDPPPRAFRADGPRSDQLAETQHQRHRPQRRQQPPQPLQPPHRQPRQPQPRKPAQRPTQATCWSPATPFSLSNRWNVARLTSAISSSPRTKRCPDPGTLLSDCGTSAAGSVDANALPASESPNPAAPSVVAAAALVVLLPLAACLIRAMVGSLDTFDSS